MGEVTDTSHVDVEGPTNKITDTLYLPPCDVAMRESLEEWSRQSGVPLLVQRGLDRRLSEHGPKKPPFGLEVWDAFPALFLERWHWLDELGADSHMVWPVVPGLSEDLENFDRVCQRLASRGVVTVQPILLELGPREKRWLFENRASEALDYETLFSSEPIVERNFVDIVLSHDLREVVPRPRPNNLSPRQLRCRDAAEHLALEAESLGHRKSSPTRVQDFYSAATRVEETHLDLDSLARDGNLGFLSLPPSVADNLQRWLDSEDIAGPAHQGEVRGAGDAVQ